MIFVGQNIDDCYIDLQRSLRIGSVVRDKDRFTIIIHTFIPYRISDMIIGIGLTDIECPNTVVDSIEIFCVQFPLMLCHGSYLLYCSDLSGIDVNGFTFSIYDE